MNNKTALLAFLICITLISGPGICQTSMPAAGSQQAPPSLTVEQIIKKLEKRYDAADFSADFSQESTLKAMDITDTATGRVWFKHPGMMRWEYETPEKHAIITDGRTLWIYRPADNQVVIGDALAYFSNGKGASFLSNFALVKEMFTVSRKTPDTENQYKLKLIPHEKQLDLSEILVNLDKKNLDILSVITLNAYDDMTRIKFTNLKFKQDIDASLFHFQVPKDADVVRLDE